MSATATGIMISENLPEDLDLSKLEDFDSLDDGDFLDWVNAPGRYLLDCLNVKTQDDGTHKPSENLMFKVVGGTPADQKGKVFMERIYHSAIERALKIAKRMGVWNDEQNAAFIEAVRNSEPAVGPDFAPCVGKRFVGVLKGSEHNGKTQIKLDFLGIWQASDPRVADFVASVQGAGSESNSPTKSTGTVKEPSKGKTGSTAGTATTTAKPKRQPAAAVDDL